MLIYSPAFDVSHCVFRILYILNMLDEKTIIETDKIQIIDFYLAYPACIKEFKFPLDLSETKNNFKDIRKEYRNPINNNETFKKINTLQKRALMNIISQGFLDVENYKKGYIKKTDKRFTSELKRHLSHFSFYGNQLLPIVLVVTLLNIDLNGEKGLKARSGLMEYRYANY
ncbi:ABC-three component system middle component 5 [Acinetobacter sp. neg1]|uniref:ABC-three component system middle component 5 n=1 Tax=Acinetobacter sp. neg1 TaxID=1561068 RepID=UPI0006476F20|nr:ABC-three component system middle component 5 [Acinetobacter sp. neg1]